MDLRPYNLTPEDIARAKQLFAYQPFVISDSICTGVAYNWLHEADPEGAWRKGAEVYDRAIVGPEKFQLAAEANLKLQRTYDRFVMTLCHLFPGGSYLDVSCNNGYFPVTASLNGMGESVGLDPGDFGGAIEFLNRVTGSRAAFVRGGYAPIPPSLMQHTAGGDAPLGRQFDVVSNLEFMCHLADPLHFLHAVASAARKAVFLWSGFVDSDEYIIRLNPPLASAPPGQREYFWGEFSSGTAISTKLVYTSMAMLGFPHALEVASPPDGLPPDWHEKNMPHYQRHRAFLFIRDAYFPEVSARMGR
jgi:hypothetical protein